jgi:hypothetical protein
MTTFFPMKSFPEVVNWDEWRASPLKISYQNMVVNFHSYLATAGSIYLLGNCGYIRNTPGKSSREHKVFHEEDTRSILTTCKDNLDSPGLCVVIPGGTLDI